MRNARAPGQRERLRQAFERIDPEPVIAALEELASPARQERLKEVFSQRIGAVTVVMDAPHDPHNGAAVMRSCDAFGVGRIHVVERVGPFSASNAVAKGTERWVDVINHRDVASAVAAMRASGHELIGTHPKGELRPSDLQRIERLALVMGNEHAGIGEDLGAACSRYVQVPMRGFVESLNVSVTAAILLASTTADRPGDLDAQAQRRLYARGLVLSVPRALEILAARGLDPLTATADT